MIQNAAGAAERVERKHEKIYFFFTASSCDGATVPVCCGGRDGDSVLLGIYGDYDVSGLL